MQDTIDQLIINPPFEEPAQPWSYEREVRQFALRPRRRPAGHLVATPRAQAFAGRRSSKTVFVVAPGLTVKSRLQVLIPSNATNFYDEFHVVPPGLEDKLRQGRVRVRNWHTLSWETDEQIAKEKGVDKRGAKSD